jgi:hypothetical protein
LSDAGIPVRWRSFNEEGNGTGRRKPRPDFSERLNRKSVSNRTTIAVMATWVLPRPSSELSYRPDAADQ